MVCSVQVHSHRPPPEETDEVDAGQVLESSSQLESQETDSSEESRAAEEEEAQRVVSDAQEEDGKT